MLFSDVIIFCLAVQKDKLLSFYLFSVFENHSLESAVCAKHKLRVVDQINGNHFEDTGEWCVRKYLKTVTQENSRTFMAKAYINL